MAFGVVFMLDTTHHYLVDDNMTSPGNVSGADSNSYFAVNRTDGYFYSGELISGSYYITKRSLTDASLSASYNCTSAGIGEQNAFIVDGAGNIWSFLSSSQYLYKWDSGLVGYTTYDIGSVVGGQIYNASMTADGLYIYVTGPLGGSRDRVAQLNSSNPAGGANWEVNLGTNNCVYPTVGDSGNVYVSGYSTEQRTRKLSVTDGSYLWPSPYYIDGGYYHSYCFENDRLYLSRYSVSDDHRYYQINPSNGATVGYTEYLASRSWCCSVYDQDTLYVGAATGGGSPEAVRKFSITSDWGVNESTAGSYAGGSVRHYFVGDPTGYIHEQITGTSSYSDFDGKVVLYVNSSTSDLDGKVVIFTTTVTNDFDGKVVIHDSSENELDGRVRIGYGSDDDFDGRIFLYSSDDPTLDGSIVIYNGTDGYPAPLDGKVLIYKHTIQISQLQVKTGNFVGDGTGERSITGIGFEPEIVLIIGDYYGCFWRTKDMTGSICYDGIGYERPNCLTALERNGFTINNNYANESGRTYDYIAMRFNGGTSDAYLGTYVGNEVDDRGITEPGFQPDFIFTKGNVNGFFGPRVKTSTMESALGDATRRITGAATYSNQIQQLLSNGFQLGSSQAVNWSGKTYYYFCINEDSSRIKVGTYVGDGSDNRNITSVGFSPNMVWLSGLNNGELAVERGENQPLGPDYTYYMAAYAGNGSNRIQSFLSNGFQVGSNVEVNESGITYDYIAFRDGGEYFDPDFNGKIIIHKNWSNDFDGKVVVDISNVDTEDFDGKIIIFRIENSSSSFDGKVSVISTLDSTETSLDGKVDIYRGREVDGRIVIYSFDDSNSFDGDVDVVYHSVNDFDGEIDVVYSSVNDFDGKINVLGTAQLFSFHINNVFDDIEYPTRTYSESMGEFNNYTDTRTIAIIGLGRREEYLTNEAMLDAADDLTVDLLDEDDRLYLKFGDNNGSGRYFRTSVYPIVSDSLQIYRTYKGSEELIDLDEYECSEQYGYIVLDHPLESYDTLRVSYIAEPDLNNPRLFTEFDDLEKIHGSPSSDNTLSLAAKMAFENGAIRVLACQASESDTYFTDAFLSLEKEECYWIVPVPKIGTTYAAITVAGKAHVVKMSDIKRRRERVLLCGEVSNNTERLYRTDAVDINSERVVMFAPTIAVNKVVGGETLTLDGRFIAAAAAGKLSGLERISYPLTNKTLQNFSIDRRHAINFNRNRDTQTGVSFLSLLSTGAEVWHGVNTIQNGVAEDQEISLIRIRDFVIGNLRKNLDKFYIGSAYNDNVILSITGSVRSYLDSVMSKELIQAYQNVTVKKDSIEARQINITFDIEPVYPLNTISIAFGYTLI